MAENWPATLPKYVLVDGYAHGTPDGRLISNTDAGPPKVRRRSSASVAPLEAAMIFTTAQRATLTEFIETTLIGGVLPFNFPDPQDPENETILVQFAEALPGWSAYGADVWRGSLSLWVLP